MTALGQQATRSARCGMSGSALKADVGADLASGGRA